MFYKYKTAVLLLLLKITDKCNAFKMSNISNLVLFSGLLVSQFGCKKLVQVPPPINTITDEASFSTDVSAAAVLNGIYVNMSKPIIGGFTGAASIPIYVSLSADDLYLSNVGGLGHLVFFKNDLISSVNSAGATWTLLYNYLYTCNSAIEGLSISNTLSVSVKKQLLGEAFFLRAFIYFNLVNLYGPLPLAVSTDYQVNTALKRSTVEDVYKLIIDDLNKARGYLSEQFLNGNVSALSTERTRPTKWAAIALLARAYLYTKDYANANIQASLLINNSSLFNLVSLNEVFLKNSRESIWQLQPTVAFWNTEDAKLFVIPPSGFTPDLNPFYLNPRLVSSFRKEDMRFQYGNWIDTTMINGFPYYYSFKYKAHLRNLEIKPENGSKPMSEYYMMLRLSEMYLVRAEGKAEQGDLMGAIADLDSIRYRAGLPLIASINPNISKVALLDSILLERRMEFFTENGHRWFDLKRTGNLDRVMAVETSFKGGVWNNRESLYPLPTLDLQRGSNLTQNPGYPVF